MRPDVLPRFLSSKIEVDASGCWVWTAYVTPRGYGRVHRPAPAAGTTSAHRAVYETLVGPVPPGLQLGHLCHDRDPGCAGGFGCRHRRCCNPEHLEPMTGSVNTAALRGCRRGLHPDGPFYQRKSRGGRECIPCRRVQKQTRRSRKKVAS